MVLGKESDDESFAQCVTTFRLELARCDLATTNGSLASNSNDFSEFQCKNGYGLRNSRKIKKTTDDIYVYDKPRRSARSANIEQTSVVPSTDQQNNSQSTIDSPVEKELFKSHVLCSNSTVNNLTMNFNHSPQSKIVLDDEVMIARRTTPFVSRAEYQQVLRHLSLLTSTVVSLRMDLDQLQAQNCGQLKNSEQTHQTNSCEQCKEIGNQADNHIDWTNNLEIEQNRDQLQDTTVDQYQGTSENRLVFQIYPRRKAVKQKTIKRRKFRLRSAIEHHQSVEKEKNVSKANESTTKFSSAKKRVPKKNQIISDIQTRSGCKSVRKSVRKSTNRIDRISDLTPGRKPGRTSGRTPGRTSSHGSTRLSKQTGVTDVAVQPRFVKSKKKTTTQINLTWKRMKSKKGVKTKLFQIKLDRISNCPICNSELTVDHQCHRD